MAKEIRMSAQANEQIDVVEIDRAAVFASNLERSTRFYARLFGLRVVESRSSAREAHVVMANDGDATLSIRERDNADGRRARLTIRVAGLDAAREALWNQGVVPTIDRVTAVSGAARYVVIVDPDGHEIELVENEIMGEPAPGLRRAPPSDLERRASAASA
jgi:catechol 2,3-dioxygenase-like lactoylglutathione lyase family enzyme